jgi:hypothetical protein
VTPATAVVLGELGRGRESADNTLTRVSVEWGLRADNKPREPRPQDPSMTRTYNQRLPARSALSAFQTKRPSREEAPNS